MNLNKIIVILSILFVSVIGLTGCGGNKTTGLRAAEITIQGKIQSIQLSKDTPGSHKLTTGSDEYYIRSKVNNLSDYLGQFVEVKGILSVENNQKVIQVESIGEPDNENNDDILKADEIESSILGFSIMIPDTWRVEENDIGTIGEIKKDRTSLAELSKTGTKTDNPTKWLSMRGYDTPELLLSKRKDVLIYKVSPLNVYLFADQNTIYHLVLRTSDTKIQELIVQSFQNISNFDKTLNKNDTNTEKAFPQPDELPSDYTKEVINTPEKKTTNEPTTQSTSSEYLNKYKSQAPKYFDLKKDIKSPYNISEIRITKDGTYAYVIINDSSQNKKRMLLKNTPIAIEEIAYFEEGFFRDWSTISGKDEAFGLPLDVYKFEITETNGTQTVSTKQTSVSADMRLYENTRYNFSMEYPKNWYYQGLGSVENSLYSVRFSESLNNSNVTILVRVYKTNDAPSVSSNATTSYEIHKGSDYTIIISSSSEVAKSFLKTMVDSVKFN